jgi:hypothetical protein
VELVSAGREIRGKIGGETYTYPMPQNGKIKHWECVSTA